MIIPLMQADAVDAYGWMSQSRVPRRRRLRPAHARPGDPHRRRRRLRGGRSRRSAARRRLAFAPSFLVILLGGPRFDALREKRHRPRLPRRRRPRRDRSDPRSRGPARRRASTSPGSSPSPSSPRSRSSSRRAPILVLLGGSRRRHPRARRRSRPADLSEHATLPVPALLAQLVEHFHGKEGVAGSSPAEGLSGTAC